MRGGLPLVLALAAGALSALSCTSPRGWYFDDSGRAERSELRDLFTLLDDPSIAGEERFAVIQAVSDSFRRRGEWTRLADFLQGLVEARPEDEYAAHHLMAIGHAYIELDDAPIAELWFDRAVKNHPDLLVKGESVHLACLRKLIELADAPERRLDYRRAVISRFADRVDLGAELFLLGKDYEAIGDWAEALDAYKRFIPKGESVVPGYPDAQRYARNLLDFSSSQKDWTFVRLDDLASRVRKALADGDPAALRRLRARVGFFAMSWHQSTELGNAQKLFEFAEFMRGVKVQAAPDWDPSSNAREAFLRTSGWSDRISTWYLYFRKIDFPADPDVHGQWEWAGIYFGERP
ncbi:MAG: tetratricopeptide repeat protein [Spirochaetia bacterium]|nr:tetratricopeptide repeat protein [Spirochaetia bacterium]